MYGARAFSMMRSLLISTFTKPTGTPMMSAGAAFSSFISCSNDSSAVGALPMAKMQGFSSTAAFSIETNARVTPRDLASCATSGSDMKQCTSPPRLARIVLLMPAFAICVSVTMSQPPFSAAMPFCTAWSENVRLSA